MDRTELADLAETAAIAATEIIREAMHEGIVIAAIKSTPTDLVTETDRAVEELILAILLERFPNASVLAEESGRRAGSGSLTWIVDPIDGTTNFVYDLSGFNVSIAAAVDGEVVAGVVADPVRAEIFRATKGGGAARNAAPIHCSQRADLSDALVGTGFSYDPARRRAQAEVVAFSIDRVRDVRRLGAAALDLCAVACGRLDAYFESGLKPWDLAAGKLIAEEAGATVRGLDGEDPDGTFVLASAPAISEELRDLLDEARRSGLAVEDLSAVSGWQAGRLEPWEPTS